QQIRITAKVCRQPLPDLGQLHGVGVQNVVALGTDFHCANVLFLQLIAVCLSDTRGQLEIQSLFQQRRGDDEDDQQHERQIEQRSDIDVTQHHQRIAL